MAPASGPSMLPTFEVLGEWLLVSKLHRFGRGISVGDVVAYNIPINEEVGVKRVLGLPGDYVLMDTPDGGGGGGGSMIQVRELPAIKSCCCWLMVVVDFIRQCRCANLYALGAARSLLDRGGQPGRVAGFEVLWACAAGTD